MLRINSTLFVLFLSLVGCCSFAHAQSSSRIYPPTRIVKPPFERAFWTYLTKGTHRYDQWGPFPGRTADLYEGESPHGAHLKLIGNRIARENAATLPLGSILIKENYDEDKKTLLAITVMYRVKDFDPANGNWYWIKYLPDGKVATVTTDKGTTRLLGRVKGCIECHKGAEGDDFAFIND